MIELGILENAYNIGIKRTVNEVWQSSFSLPKNDPKNVLCVHLNYVEIIGDSGRNYGLYRIMPTQTVKGSNSDYITYKCEHVISTLLDDVIDGYHQYSGYTTGQVLSYILSLQTTGNWVLNTCDFSSHIDYSFENENGLLAPILSVPIPLNSAYEFTYDTTVYPWKLNLKASSNATMSEIRWGKDMIDFNKVSDPTDIVNYIIPKGNADGVNQVSIASVNSGLKYLKDDVSIALWGKRSYIWIDKTIENAATLKSNAQALLAQWKDPKISFEVNSADLSVLPEYSQERKILNSVTKIIVDDEEYYARIVGEDIRDLSKEYDVKYQINNKITDIATTQADLERKQQVTEAYSQGATSIMTFSNQDSCDPFHPVSIPFYIDNDIVNVNTCDITYRTKPYRAYTAETQNTTIGSLTSTYVLGTEVHSHNVTVPAHKHNLAYGIHTLDGVTPSSLVITVDGTTVPTSSLEEDRFDIMSYLTKTGGKVTRGLHEITISPVGAAARLEATVILRVFIQSRLGGVY